MHTNNDKVFKCLNKQTCLQTYVFLNLRLFHKNSETKNYFKRFRNMDDDQLSQSIQFRAHVINFMSGFNMAILHLEEPEVVIAMMNKLGESHNKLRIKGKHFEVCRTFMN